MQIWIHANVVNTGGHRVSGVVLPASGFGRQTLGVPFPASYFGRQALGTALATLDFGRQTWNVDRRASIAGRRLSGVGRLSLGVDRRASIVGRRSPGVDHRESIVGRLSPGSLGLWFIIAFIHSLLLSEGYKLMAWINHFGVNNWYLSAFLSNSIHWIASKSSYLSWPAGRHRHNQLYLFFLLSTNSDIRVIIRVIIWGEAGYVNENTLREE